MYPSLEAHLSKYVKTSPEDITLFYSLFKERNISAKNFLVKPDSSLDHDYFVTKGCLKAYYQLRMPMEQL